jgi:uncharacterized protein
MRIFFDIIVFTALGLAILFAYLYYWDDIRASVFGEEVTYTLYINNVPVRVSVADDPALRTKGLSGVTSLRTNEGKLFVFPENGKHGIWMKDMLFPIDILWIDENLRIVHIAEKIDPSTYPTIFAPEEDARFVLETNAFFVDSFRISVGDSVFVPPEILPVDIRKRLQQ